MGVEFELDGCMLQPGSGVGEALDAAGVDGSVDARDTTDASDEARCGSFVDRSDGEESGD